MKNLISMAAVLCVGAIGFTPGDALGGATTLGSHCAEYSYQQATPPPIVRTVDSTTTGIYSANGQLLALTCPIPVETKLPNQVGFRARVYDSNPNTNVLCYGNVYNQDGGLIVASAAMVSLTQPEPATGYKSLSTGVNVATQDVKHTYTINCLVPSGQWSGVVTARAY